MTNRKKNSSNVQKPVKEVQVEETQQDETPVEEVQVEETQQDETPVEEHEEVVADVSPDVTVATPDAPVATPDNGYSDLVMNSIVIPMDEYVRDMKPNRVMELGEVVRNQRKLFNVYTILFRLDGKDFTDGMDYIVSKVREARGDVFNEYNAFRALPVVNFRSNQYRVFTLFTNLLICTADSKTRETVKDVNDFTVLYSAIENDDVIQKIEAYFA